MMLLDEKDRLRDERRRLHRTLGALGISDRMIDDYLGPKRSELAGMAALEERVTVVRYRDRRTMVEAAVVFGLVLALERVVLRLEEMRARARHARRSRPERRLLS
jgi:hypothetical protein